MIVKLLASNSIHSGVLRISDTRRSTMVSTIHLYCNNKPVSDVSELKNRWDLWKRVKTLSILPQQGEVRFEIAICIVSRRV
jgi:E3 ubiquitin-protein ligase UBR4